MTRFALAALVVGAFAAGCNKPAKEDCRAAIENMRALLRTTQLQTDVEGEIRRCTGGSSKEAVACAMKATTLDELRTCKFMSIPDDIEPTSPAGSGSATK